MKSDVWVGRDGKPEPWNDPRPVGRDWRWDDEPTSKPERDAPKFTILEPPRETLLAEIANLKGAAEARARWSVIFVGAIFALILVQTALMAWRAFHG